MKERKKLEAKVEGVGCPFFFSPKCEIELTDERFNKYCLDHYKNCNNYKRLK